MSDPHDELTKIITTTIGVFGFLFAILSHRWNRRESRLDALGKILQPMLKTAQFLKKANAARRACDQLKYSYPELTQFPEVAGRVKTLFDEYGEHIKSSGSEFSNAEAEFGARHFRFPDGVSEQLRTALKSLTNLGGFVNAGSFDKADVEIAKFLDDYKRITTTARGWRLADPIEGIRKRLARSKKPEADTQSEFELTDEEMKGILDLATKRATTQAQNGFVVHPPKIILDNPGILKSDTVVEQLKDSIFSVVFQDGTAKMLSLPELMALTYNLIVTAQTAAEIHAMMQVASPQVERQFKVSHTFAMKEIMQPEMVKTLLEKITFAGTPSDG